MKITMGAFLPIYLILVSCSGGDMLDNKQTQSVSVFSKESLRVLDGYSIFFGHQSVGADILQGVKDIITDDKSIKLVIGEGRTFDDLAKGKITHTIIGKNENPFSKIKDFTTVIDGGIGGKVDVAFYKFCYIDFVKGTDVNKVFDDYKTSIAALKNKYPKTTFVHVTVPLRTTQKGWKVWIKKLTNKPIGGYEDNIVRNQFNDLLVNEYSGKEPVYDLAQIESTYPDGHRSTFSHNGKKYYSLADIFTKDGGHLNEIGRRIIAEKFLAFLAILPKKQQ